jgi:arylsulfatase A-like enzyme
MEVHEARLLTELDRLGPLFANEPLTERRRYVQAVRELSGHVGAFVEELAARPGFDDALFAVVSDHGEFLEGEHAHVGDPRTHGFLVYESQARVPWILYSPAGRLPRGRVIDEPVELLDLMPTVLAWAGLEPPAGLAGRSLVPLIEDPAAALERPEFFVVETRFRGAHKIAAFTRDWELVQTSDGHPGVRPLELQPRGLQDGAATDMSLERPDEADRLSGLLRTWMEAHPEAPATYASTEVPARVARHLGELGYL